MCHQIAIQQPSGRAGSGATEPFSPFAASWAAIRALSGQELYRAQQIVNQVTHLITIPYIAGLSAGMTIVFQTRTFQIMAIQDPDERQIELRLLCVERSSNA
jgi:SPP1 family predicted phage head-tail adaptor